MKSIAIYSIILSFLNAVPLINVGASVGSPTSGSAQNIGPNANNWGNGYRNDYQPSSLLNVGVSALSPSSSNAQNIATNNKNAYPYNNWWGGSPYGYGGYGWGY
ncbi:hypothetical protein CONCODRAFT_12985 [Conidiobolus coronatus NRRL 28638]|uniref:Uncharacterized protein n=1 Tax=Conidiobolus coronatus (strain ATCC 28846 / CBS 209.66 / NRRL 28638) TaxID=796925 RepID=A0A137NRM8_CONC2|nr:hypothetical protein CONCODRAFT_12985 [Conidiobolus coronatus NRRL 28638]|eukprot:KXN65419.1 hypothetical protein CONCODRAFT_12985 [Conidiobolus coronatus NRRL 28638]